MNSATEKPLRVLIAHPDRQALSALLQTAKRAGLSCAAAKSLPEVLSLLKAQPFDAVYVSVLLPGLLPDALKAHPVYRALTKRPAVLYGAPRGAGELMIRGFAPILADCSSPETLLRAICDICPPEPEEAVLKQAARVLSQMGIQNGRGAEYLAYAVGLCVNDADNARLLSARVYPRVAKRFSVTPRSAGESMRRAIDRAFLSGNIDKQYEIFGNTIDDARGKPTLSALLARAAEMIRLGEDEAK